MATIHKLKLQPEYFDAVKKGIKPWEYRLNDRNYKVGDFLELNEYSQTTGYTGNKVCAEVKYVFGIMELQPNPSDYVIMTTELLLENEVHPDTGKEIEIFLPDSVERAGGFWNRCTLKYYKGELCCWQNNFDYKDFKYNQPYTYKSFVEEGYKIRFVS